MSDAPLYIAGGAFNSGVGMIEDRDIAVELCRKSWSFFLSEGGTTFLGAENASHRAKIAAITNTEESDSCNEKDRMTKCVPNTKSEK